MRAQAAVEYLIVIAFMTAVIVPIAYFYLYSVNATTDDVVESAVDYIGHTLSDTAKDVYYSSGYAKRTINLKVPEDVVSITGQRMRDIIIEVQTDTGIQAHFFKGDVPISVMLDQDKLVGGSYIIEKKLGVVAICTDSCQCDATEQPADCGDNWDNDCDGQIDDCDTDCPGTTDGDNDGWTLECDIPDCDDTLSDINPVAYDSPGNGIDEDCDGLDAI